MTTELDQYAYDLPSELIAQHPVPHRADARLMVVERDSQSWHHAHVRDLPELLRANDCLVLNRSQVIPARLLGHRTDTGGRWTGLFLDADDQGVWQVIGQTRGKLQPDCRVELRDAEGRSTIRIRFLAPLGEGRWAVVPENVEAESPLEILQRVGHVPLPHYIRDGQMVEADRVRYQTVYADRAGSVAAPTAGLHFTTELLERCAQAGIGRSHVTLHVGLGTFRPIKTQRLADHTMHLERGEIDASTVETLRETQQADGRRVAVGTTTVRLLETAARSGTLQPWSGETNLFIHPPFSFHATDCLLTNFHLPRSSLLVLVRTFGGDRLIQAAYEEAVDQRYRFFSYGDAMLIL